MVLLRNWAEDKMTMLPPDPVYIFKGEMVSVSCVEFQISEHIQRMFAGTQSGTVHVWNLKSKREMNSFKSGNDVCLSICISQEEDIVITHTKSGNIAFWTEAQGNNWQLKTSLQIDFFGFCKCQLLHGVLYLPVKNSQFHLVSAKAQEKLRTINLQGNTSGEVMAFKACTMGKATVMFIAYEGHKLELWDLEEQRRRSCLQLSDCPMAVDYEVVSGRGLCGDPSDKVVVFSLDERLEFKVVRHIMLANAGVATVRIRPDGKLAAIGCWDGKLRLYSWKSLVLLAVLDTHSATIQDVTFTRDYEEGQKKKYLLAAASKDARVSLWDLYN